MSARMQDYYYINWGHPSTESWLYVVYFEMDNNLPHSVRKWWSCKDVHVLLGEGDVHVQLYIDESCLQGNMNHTLEGKGKGKRYGYMY